MLSRWLQKGGSLAEQARRHIAGLGVKPPPPPGAGPGAGLAGPLGAVLRRMADPAAAETPAAAEPPAPPPAPPGAGGGGNPTTLAALRSLRPGCDPGEVERCLRLLMLDFKRTDCQDFQGGYAKVFSAVQSGTFPPDRVINAYEWAVGRAVRNPGAAFNKRLQALGWQG
jgi:hypothetical protein